VERLCTEELLVEGTVEEELVEGTVEGTVEELLAEGTVEEELVEGTVEHLVEEDFYNEEDVFLGWLRQVQGLFS